jgi:hypothetical protein
VFHLVQFEGPFKHILYKRSRFVQCNNRLVHTTEFGDVVFNDAPFCLQRSAWSRLTTCWQMVVVMFQNPLPEGRRTLPLPLMGSYKMCRQFLHNCRSSSGENFFSFRAFAASVNAIVATTKQYSDRSSERQSTETCSKKNLRPQALDVDERDTVIVGARGRRLRPVPPEKTHCREPTVTALRML